MLHHPKTMAESPTCFFEFCRAHIPNVSGMVKLRNPHGLISTHMPSIAKMAAARAEKAAERARLFSSTGGMEETCREDVAEERARALWQEAQAEKERCESANALAFLTLRDAVPRLISFMVALQTYRPLKSCILARNGENWALGALAVMVGPAATSTMLRTICG